MRLLAFIYFILSLRQIYTFDVPGEAQLHHSGNDTRNNFLFTKKCWATLSATFSVLLNDSSWSVCLVPEERERS